MYFRTPCGFFYWNLVGKFPLQTSSAFPCLMLEDQASNFTHAYTKPFYLYFPLYQLWFLAELSTRHNGHGLWTLRDTK